MTAGTATSENTTSVDLITLVDQFLEEGLYVRGWSPRTARTYRQGLVAYAQRHPDRPTKGSLQAFVVSMRERGLSPGGCNVRIRALNSFLTWLHEQEVVPGRLRLKVLRDERKPVTTFSDAEVRRLLAFRPKGVVQARTWTLALLLLDCGLRIDEALGLERQGVDLDGLFLKVVGKGNKQRLVPISPECRKHLYRLLRGRDGGARWVFGTRGGGKVSYRNVYRDLKVLCGEVGIDAGKVHPHNFRHCFAVNYIRRGGDIYRLSRILGHTTISTTQLYLRSMGIEHLQEGHRQLSPLSQRGC